METKMKFLCEDSCVNTKDGESWRGAKDYDLTEREVRHLKEIGHLKRFRPLSNSALDFMKKLEEIETKVRVDKPHDEMTVAELKEVAKTFDVKIPKDAKRAEILLLITEATEGSDKAEE